jgi:hypothetical protein
MKTENVKGPGKRGEKFNIQENGRDRCDMG